MTKEKIKERLKLINNGLIIDKNQDNGFDDEILYGEIKEMRGRAYVCDVLSAHRLPSIIESALSKIMDEIEDFIVNLYPQE